MAQRLVDTYRLDETVEILFQDEVAEEWRPARVVALQHPGLWVLTDDRRLWFVTNGKRIRALVPSSCKESPRPCLVLDPDHPSATSRIIMTANPSIAPMVDMCVSCPCCDSGISSSTTT